MGNNVNAMSASHSTKISEIEKERQKEEKRIVERIEFWNITDLIHPLSFDERRSHLIYGYMRRYYDFNLGEVVEICLKYIGFMKIISETEKKCVYEGYLQKESLYLKRFRKRWIVLKGHYLYSFKNCTVREEPTEVIDLKLFYAVKQFKKFNNYKDNHTFSIISLSQNKLKRSFIGSSRNTIEWMNHIRRKIPIYTENAKLIENVNHMVHISITIKATNYREYSNDKFIICASYLKEEKIQNIFDCIKKKYNPLLSAFTNISFGGRIYEERIYLNDKSLIDYNKDSIIRNGIQMDVSLRDIYASRRYDFSEY